ncbi:hypothetical protein HU200_017020 [Digitaria exilis]|uniref:Uncharacterized protein n=1 Tax=Digitaria exilis TaxID=1010633 RepID=A0A835KHW8_9POAL|nr:hypothetical protein HU200_017020 [Digitaria exilis]
MVRNTYSFIEENHHMYHVDLSPAARDFDASGGLDRAPVSPSIISPLVVGQVGSSTMVHLHSMIDKVLVETMEETTHAADEEGEVVILEEMPPSRSPRKRRARKPRGPVDLKFLRRSTRLSKDLQGFKGKSSGEVSSNVVVKERADTTL